MGGGSQAAWPQDTLVTAYSRVSTTPMDLTTLKEESRRLARRSHLLTQAGEGEPAGWLLGEGNQIALRLEERIVRAVGDGRGGGELEVLAKTPSGAVPLHAVERVSFAPIEAIFLLGSDQVGDWLNTHGWEREWGYNDNFAGAAVVQEFEQWWRASHVFYGDEGEALLGGWHFAWPDDDWHDLVDQELLYWTLRGEPWIEVWRSGSGYQVIERIS